MPLALLLVGGCTSIPDQQGDSPLKPSQMSHDSVVLDIFFVRCPFDASEVNDRLWQQVDELQFPAELRQRLLRNGFRVGMIDGQIPPVLTELLQLSDEAVSTDSTQIAEADSMEGTPRVLRRHLQLRSERRGEILASGIYDSLPVLMCESGQLTGETYQQAQAMLSVTAFPETDGRVRLELVPELHHDKARQQWVGRQGMVRLETSRPRRVFEQMKITASLSPGALVVLSSLPERPGSLGHHFFTEDQEQLQQKLLIVRLSQTQHDDLVHLPKPLDVDAGVVAISRQ